MLPVDKHCGLTHSRVREFFSYDPDEGVLRWKVTRKKAYPGRPAGHLLADGYYQCTIDGRNYQVHRIIWFWMTGHWPKQYIDHKNGNKTNNTWNNLREATPSQNCMNKTMPSNMVGCKGISWNAKTNKYRASVMKDGITYSLGSYKTLDDALEAYENGVNNYHKEFGRIDV